MVTPINHNQAGFTLLEVVIYLALFGLLMTSALPVVYQVLQSMRQTEYTLATQGAGDFIIAKLTSALAGAATVEVVDIQTLRITRSNLGSFSPITVSVTDGVWYLARGEDEPVALSSIAHPTHDVVFEVSYPSEVGYKLAVTFWLDNQFFYFVSYGYE